MSITITLYNFSKRENSTKQPTRGVEVQAVFKNATSKYNPSFILNIENPLNYNYVKYNNMYYYINDAIMLSNNHVEYQCEVDVLATWKNDISKVSAFTLFSSLNYDVGISDIRLSSNPEVIRKSAKVSPFGDAQERYITGILLQGFSDVYCLSWGDLSILTLAIMSSAYGELFTDPLNGISKILTDTSKCITSCYYNPCTYVNSSSTTTPNLAGGYYVDGVELNPPLRDKKLNVSVNIPWAFPLSDFRNRSQFTSLSLYLPGYGVLSLNADNYFGKSSINIDICVDSGGGEITYYVEGLSKCTCNVLCPVQCSTTSTGNMANAISNAIGAVGSAISGNPLGAGAGLFGAIVSSLETNPGSVGGTGGQSSFAIKKDIVLTLCSHDTNTDPSTLSSNYGRPCNKVKTITEGYNECTNASVNCNAPQYLKDKINSYLNGGLYYE